VRSSEFWELVEGEFGAARARSLVRDHVLRQLGHCTGQQAMEAGEPLRDVWLALCDDLDVPEELRWRSTAPRRRGRR